jgi:threonine dehydrogenase-like Zn-dependent dehydrogenase
MVASDLPHAVEVVSAGGLELTPLISHRYPIGNAPEAFATLAERRGLKVIVNPS